MTHLVQVLLRVLPQEKSIDPSSLLCFIFFCGKILFHHVFLLVVWQFGDGPHQRTVLFLIETVLLPDPGSFLLDSLPHFLPLRLLLDLVAARPDL